MTESTALKISRQTLLYQLEGKDPEKVVVTNAALIQWDFTRATRSWPTYDEAPFLFQAFIVWHSLSHSGRYKGDFEAFRKDCVATENLEDEEEVVDPTKPGPDLSSSTP